MERGIVLFGVNNTKIDYVKLAKMAAAFARKNMPNVPIALISDRASLDWHDDLQKHFDVIVEIPATFKEFFKNARGYRDTQYYEISATFRNESRSAVYALSPFNETLLIDADYLIGNNSLNAVWGSVEDVMINRDAISLDHKQLGAAEFRLSPYGIRMYWATVIYFKKGERAKLLFDLVEHIRENWDFYQLTYGFPGKMYRNDYSFSIAIHILNGFVQDGDFAARLPDDTILTALDSDQFFKIRSPSDLTFFYYDRKQPWKFCANRVKGLNVHCMNKLSLLNNYDNIMDVLK